jgi:hypothetical protein
MEKHRGLYEKPWELLDFELFLKAKSHEPCPQARGPAVLSVHHGPKEGSGGGFTGAHAQGRFGEWELVVMEGKGRGVNGGVVSQNRPMGVDRQHESREAESLYPSTLPLTRALRLKFVGRAT